MIPSRRCGFHCLAIFVIFFASAGYLVGQVNGPPIIDTFTQSAQVKEGGITTLNVSAHDPDGDTLTYTWTVQNAANFGGNAVFKSGPAPWNLTQLSGVTTVSLGLKDSAASYEGQTIDVLVEVSDGTDSASETIPVTVSGLNQKPVIAVKSAKLGSSTFPLFPRDKLEIDASTSSDDGPIQFLWTLTNLQGPGPCGNAGAIIPRDAATSRVWFSVPEMREGRHQVTMRLTLEDGMHLVTDDYVGYLSSDETPCIISNPNPPSRRIPVVSLSATPSSPTTSQFVTLRASVTNQDVGDTYSYSFLQENATTNQVTLSNATGQTPSTVFSSTFSAPSFATLLRFRVTVTDAEGTGGAAVNVQVRDTGGGGGGGGTPPEGQVNEGTAAGTPAVCIPATNKPAVATLPAKVTVASGSPVLIVAENAHDLDVPASVGCCVNGKETTALGFQWKVLNSGGLELGNLSSVSADRLSFTAPGTSTTKTASLRSTVVDAKGCGTSYDLSLVVMAAQNPTNTPPTGSLRFQVQGTQSPLSAAPATPVEVPTPASVTLDAQGQDVDGDTLTYSWAFQPSLTGVSLSGNTGKTIAVQAADGVDGDVTVTVTISDGKGGSSNHSIVLRFQATTDKEPVAMAAVMFGGEALPSGKFLSDGEEFILDASESFVPEAEGDEVLTFQWEQIGGPTAFSKDLESEQAIIRVDDVTQVTTLLFRLTVRNGTKTATATADVPVQPGIPESPEGSGELYFAQVGFGPFVDPVTKTRQRFQTVLVIDVLSETDADDVMVEFFDQTGEPLTFVDPEDPENPLPVHYLDTVDGMLKPWDSMQPLTIPAGLSRVIEFKAPEVPGISPKAGWAQVTSSARLKGSVRFQQLDEVTQEFVRDVGLFSSPRGKQFQAAYRSVDSLALAIANPEETQRAVVVLSLWDAAGELLAEDTVPVSAGRQMALPLSGFFRFYDITMYPEATLTIEVEGEGTVTPTLLITRDSLAVSSQSFARTQ